MYQSKHEDKNLEPIIIIAGFLGAGKTTLLGEMLRQLRERNWQPFVVLNDYESARLDASLLQETFEQLQIAPLTGACVCCTGLNELRGILKDRPKRDTKPITLIEANGTTQAYDLLGHLSIGLDEAMAPPVQVTVINAKFWQKRGAHNQLERDQLRTASYVYLSWLDSVSKDEQAELWRQIQTINPRARRVDTRQLMDICQVRSATIHPDQECMSRDVGEHHEQAHWSSLQLELPKIMKHAALDSFMSQLSSIPNVRVKGCVSLASSPQQLIYFECFADGSSSQKPFPGRAAFGTRCIVIAPCLDPHDISKMLQVALST